MESKKCTKCGEVKNISEFYGDKRANDKLTSSCKSCVIKDTRKWRLANLARVKKQRKLHYAQNQERAKQAVREWIATHPEMKRNMQRRYDKKRRATPEGKLNCSLSGALRRTLRGGKSFVHWENIVSFSVDQLKRHLEKQFTPEMNWGNYGTYWHIDHKIPIAAFNFQTVSDTDFKRCWALKNLQPLPKSVNCSKQDRLERPFQPSLTL